jgi:hypothetical protein
MPDINERKRGDNDTGKTVESGVGVAPGDTIASALDPFGTAAGPVASGALDYKAGEGTVNDRNIGSKTRD